MALNIAPCRLTWRYIDKYTDDTIEEINNYEDTRMKETQGIIDICYKRAELSAHRDIIDLDILLEEDGTVIEDTEADIDDADSQASDEYGGETQFEPNNSKISIYFRAQPFVWREQRHFPAHYRIPPSVLQTYHATDFAARKESWALACLLYKVWKLEKPYDDLNAVQVQSMYENGMFPENLWSLPFPVLRFVLVSWLPEFQQDVIPSPTRVLHKYVFDRPVLFILQSLGVIAAFTSLQMSPLLGIVASFTLFYFFKFARATWWWTWMLVLQLASMLIYTNNHMLDVCHNIGTTGCLIALLVVEGRWRLENAIAHYAYGSLAEKDEHFTRQELKERFEAAWKRKFPY